MIDIAELKEELQQAEQNFNYADQQYIDAAIYRLKAVEEKFNAAIKEVKSYGENVKRERQKRGKRICETLQRTWL
jgi:hypothetical protein